MAAAVHIGLGDGPLSFGLLKAVTRKCEFDRHVVARPGTEHEPFYKATVHLRNGDTNEETIDLASFTGPHDAVPEQIARSLDDAELVLITASLRGAMAQRVPLVRAIVALCPGDCEVVFIACENSLTDAHQDLIDELGASGVHCPRAIVDRVCIWPGPNGDKPAFRHVITHEVGEWLIATESNGSRLTQALARAEEVGFIPPEDYDAYDARKAWFVNGVHVFIASSGRVGNLSNVLPELLDDPDVLTQIQELIGAMADAVESRHGLKVESEWALDRQRAWLMLPDSSRRILKSFVRRDTAPFVDGFGKRIGAPARVLHDQGKDVEPFVAAALNLMQLLQRGVYYSDWHEIGPGELTEEADLETVEALRAALDGWFPEGDLDYEVAGVKGALTSQRRACEEIQHGPDQDHANL